MTEPEPTKITYRLLLTEAGKMTVATSEMEFASGHSLILQRLDVFIGDTPILSHPFGEEEIDVKEFSSVPRQREE